MRYAPIRISTPSFLDGDNFTTTYLLGLSISTPDWSMLCAARMAKNIKLSGGEKGGEVDERTYVFQLGLAVNWWRVSQDHEHS